MHFLQILGDHNFDQSFQIKLFVNISRTLIRIFIINKPDPGSTPAEKVVYFELSDVEDNG